MNVLVTGEQVPGFKLVRGRSNRAWKDEAAADRWLTSQGMKEKERYDFKLKGPAKIEKILTLTPIKKKNFLGLIEKPEGKLTYAREEDPRPAVIMGGVDELFAEQDELDSL